MSRCVSELERAGREAIAACDGRVLVRDALRARPCSARAILAVGKAAPAMALGAIDAGVPARGLVVAKEAADVGTLELLLAGHPKPDERSVVATRRALEIMEQSPLVLLSGGTSALLGGPVEGVSLDELRAITSTLLRSGATIDEMNRERRRLGAALGGRLLAASSGPIRALILSDVMSGDIRTIGSGPLHPDGEVPARLDATIIATPATLLAAISRALEQRDFVVHGALFAGPMDELVHQLDVPLAPGHAIVRVGEPTLVVTGRGEGGRAQHAALLLAGRIAGTDHVALALASDGSDGPNECAGAIVDGATLTGIDASHALREHDSGTLLERLGARLRTGATGTNLTDLYVVARCR